jgi:hypothetical protein
LFLCVALQQTGTLFAADTFVKDLLSKLPIVAVCTDAGAFFNPTKNSNFQDFFCAFV